MHLTMYTDYSLRMLIYLQVHPQQPTSVRQIAEAYGISANHLAKVAQRLTQLGWIASRRGRGGGLLLEPQSPELTIGHVVRTLEPAGDLVECHGQSSSCPIEPACHLRSILLEAQQAFYTALDRYTLADLGRQPQRLIALLSPGAALPPRQTPFAPRT